ncbi:LysR family transcriptional regulator [Kaistia sp. 32K]|uniref:LysR family transcriptional regulator n=1 Tax=Kaistia sp. 32K TaxID=2795690 RepID=UPI0019156DEE|nr:LysR family transcriptional regulator [Kaistia sp. 32K]BCP51502.1 LysR family transcriptional regulator [Kaistia sp. 32K]
MEQMDLEAVRLFVAVARQGGLNAASRETGVPKATMSRRIRQLEASLGTLLLERSGRRMRMTDDGRRLFDRAAPLLADLASAGAEISARDGEVRGTLRVSVPALLARSGIGAFATAFVKRYPQVKLEIDVDDRFVDPVAEGYDLVVRANPAADSDLVGKCFLRTEVELAAAPEIPLPTGQNEVVDAVILTATGGQASWTVLNEGGPLTVLPRETIRCSSMMLVYDAVLSGAGVALLPAWLIEPDLREGRLRAWGRVPNRHMEAWVLHTPAHLSRPKIRAFVDALVEAYRSGGNRG